MIPKKWCKNMRPQKICGKTNAEKPRIGKDMRKLCEKCFCCVGNRMLIKLLRRILEGCNSCFKTAIPKNADLFSRCRKGQKFSFLLLDFAICTNRIFPHIFPHISAFSRIFSAFFPGPADRIISPPPA